MSEYYEKFSKCWRLRIFCRNFCRVVSRIFWRNSWRNFSLSHSPIPQHVAMLLIHFVTFWFKDKKEFHTFLSFCFPFSLSFFPFPFLLHSLSFSFFLVGIFFNRQGSIKYQSRVMRSSVFSSSFLSLSLFRIFSIVRSI